MPPASFRFAPLACWLLLAACSRAPAPVVVPGRDGAWSPAVPVEFVPGEPGTKS